MHFSRLAIALAALNSFAFGENGYYAGYTNTALIPFDYNSLNAATPFSDKIKVTIKIADSATTFQEFHPSIDTGTCGFMFSAIEYPLWTRALADANPSGWEFLSSSKLLYSGHWIPTDMILTTAAGVEVKVSIPVLAVEKKTVCKHWVDSYGADCPTVVGQDPPEETDWPTGVRLMGVGFGRQADGQPQGDPDKNAFLNVRKIGTVDTPTGSTTYRNGYIISKQGITLGLTEENTLGMKFLDLGDGATADPRDWATLPACLAVGSRPCVPGTTLIDTGISHSFMTLPTSFILNRHDEINPSTGKASPALDDDSFVHVKFGRSGVYQAELDFYAGSTSGIAIGPVPDNVFAVRRNDRTPYFNTGRHFLRRWKVAFDAEKGRFGFRTVWS
ncbi:outer membrane autotransporter barrel protein [Thelonectria olida]|uniref:Outer membrane autotransporter barrel protein n=1 Tax=Thelonectria olida TaxID=1576542 RepID=A0A9P8VS01_9HYPO|nr:outer membrane autotransporter barrel protein [Thelonectria olida]